MMFTSDPFLPLVKQAIVDRCGVEAMNAASYVAQVAENLDPHFRETEAAHVIAGGIVRRAVEELLNESAIVIVRGLIVPND